MRVWLLVWVLVWVLVPVWVARLAVLQGAVWSGPACAMEWPLVALYSVFLWGLQSALSLVLQWGRRRALRWVALWVVLTALQMADWTALR